MNEQLQAFSQEAKAYFEQLNQHEQYGWLAEGVGFVLFLVGMIMLVF